MSLLNANLEFWMELSKPFWENYAHPLFAPPQHYSNEMVTYSPCCGVIWEEQVYQESKDSKVEITDSYREAYLLSDLTIQQLMK